ncbi:SIR2 family protein [Verrucomicrobiota bacterium sgz303538]
MSLTFDPPAELVAAIRAKRSALFVGAGLSVAAGFPRWSELLGILIDTALVRSYITHGKADELRALAALANRQLMVAQELSDCFGKELFQTELVRIFGQRKPLTPMHLAFPEIPFSLVLTTNYDQLLENGYSKKIDSIPNIYTHADTADFADALWRGEFFILKAHGDVARKSSMILTQRDYRTIIYSSPGYRAVLTAIFTTKTLLFLGVSLDDPETQLLLDFLHDAFHGSGVYHYALVPEDQFNDTASNRWRRDFNINCLRYKASAGHPEVGEFVSRLQASL